LAAAATLGRLRSVQRLGSGGRWPAWLAEPDAAAQLQDVLCECENFERSPSGTCFSLSEAYT